MGYRRLWSQVGIFKFDELFCVWVENGDDVFGGGWEHGWHYAGWVLWLVDHGSMRLVVESWLWWARRGIAGWKKRRKKRRNKRMNK